MNNRLPILQAEAQAAHQSATHHTTEAAERALIAGAALIEAKALCKHGSWADWLRGTGIPDRTAQRYMALSKGGCNSAIVALFGWSRAERLSILGRKIWPRGGYGFKIKASDEAGFGAVIFTLPHDDGTATFWGAQICRDPSQDFLVTRRLSLPVMMGVFVEHVFETCPAPSIEMMAPDETRDILAEIQRTGAN
jgi:hypothetical protein